MNFLVQLIIGIVLSAAATLIQAALRHDEQTREGGVTGEIDVGGDNPLAFIVGPFATAGQFEYAGTWGSAGGTPNAYFTKVVSVSDLPVRGFPGFFVDGARRTLDDTADPDLGYPILDFRVGGVDYAWVKFHDGTQTAADAMLLAKFGDDADKPWLEDMIFRGVAIFIVTLRFNRTLFPNGINTAFLAEIDGIELPNDRHENPVEAMRAIALGLYYDGIWVYGPQGIGENHLVDWDAQSDKCEIAVALSGGGTEKACRVGYEVKVDQEPREVIGEFLKACSGRWADLGGRYRILVGAPDEPVLSFTDEDIVVSEGQSPDPFPGFEDTYNCTETDYPEPEEAYGIKHAPPRYSSTLEAEDADQRLPYSTTYAAVPFANQVQRLDRAAIEDVRRFRRHSLTGPPAWWKYELLDAFLWDSTWNDYDGKEFLLVAATDGDNANQLVGLQETNPADHGWSTAYELPYDFAPLILDGRPLPQVATGWSAEPYTPDGYTPSMRLNIPAGLDDVRAVRMQVRLAAETALKFDGEVPYDIDDEAPSGVPPGGFARDTDYEMRGLLVPFSARTVRWSNQDAAGNDGAWLAVTTPDVGLSEAQLDAKMRAFFQQLDQTTQAALKPLIDEIAARQAAQGQTIAGVLAMLNERIDGPGENAIVNYIGRANTSITDIKVVTDAMAAVWLEAFSGDAIAAANALFRMEAGTGPDGVGASLGFTVRAVAGDILKRAGFKIWAVADAEGGDSGWELEGNKGRILTPDGTSLNALLITTQDVPRDAPVTTEGANSVIRADLTGRQQRHITTLSTDAEMRAPTGVTPMDFTHLVKFSGAGHALTFSDEFMSPKPSGFPTADGVQCLFSNSVLSTNPLRVLGRYEGYFVDSPILTPRDQVPGSGVAYNQASYTATLSLTALDFVPGNLLLAVVLEGIQNNSAPYGYSSATTSLAVANWNDFGSAEIVDGSAGRNPLRIRALWKIADGSETTLSALGASSNWGSNTWSWGGVIAAYDVLGGTLVAATASIGATRNSTINQTVLSAGAPDLPVLAFTAGGLAYTVPGSLNWSGTPDVVVTAQVAANRAGLRFNSEMLGSLANRSASLSSAFQFGLVSGYFYFEE